MKTIHAIVLASCLAAPLTAQSVVVSAGADRVRVRSGLSFIDGDALNQLRDGRSLRLDFELAVLSGPRGSVVAVAKESFNLSFDLWEERIAVTRLSTPVRSVSHLRPGDAESWCLEHLAVTRHQLGGLTNNAPFWIKLSYQTADPIVEPDAPDDEFFTIRRLIDVFSRRPRDGGAGKSIEAGPFRLSDLRP